jgi:predicted transcriptional regulator
MPLGIVSAEDYERERNTNNKEDISSKEVVSEDTSEVGVDTDITGESVGIVGEIERIARVGRGPGNTNVPQSIRRIIGESSVEEGSGAAQAIGRFLGISQSSVSAYCNGATSTATYNRPNEDLVSHLNKTRRKISRRAQGKLFKALGKIDDQSLAGLTALEASSVAKNMSTIVKDMEPDTRNQGNTFNGPVITFYAPQLVREETFEVVHANET